MAINFPSTGLSANVTTYSAGDRTWLWTGAYWKAISATIGYTGSWGYFGSVGYTGSVGFTGSQGYWGSVGYTGSQGIVGYTGSRGDLGYTGSLGNAGGFRYNFNTNTSAPTSPVNGDLRFNDGGANFTSTIYISNLTTSGVSIASYVATWAGSTNSNIKGHLVITDSNSLQSTIVVYSIASITANSGYYAISVNYVSGTVPANGQNLVLQYSRTGDVGYTGSASTVIGYTGSQGFWGSVGYVGSASTVIGYSGSVGFTGSIGSGYWGSVGYTGSSMAGSVTVSTTAPTSPSNGALWWDPVTDVLSIYETSSSSWVAVGGGGSGSAVNDWGLVNGAVTATNDYGSIT
jgi:hypothetical protein